MITEPAFHIMSSHAFGMSSPFREKMNAIGSTFGALKYSSGVKTNIGHATHDKEP
jgi:hypothetical protein